MENTAFKLNSCLVTIIVAEYTTYFLTRETTFVFSVSFHAHQPLSGKVSTLKGKKYAFFSEGKQNIFYSYLPWKWTIPLKPQHEVSEIWLNHMKELQVKA